MTQVVRCVKDEEGHVEMGMMSVRNGVTRKNAVKVWTKLRNGLFGWRSKCKAKRRTGGVEQVTPLTLAENLGIDKNGGTQIQIKRKLDSGGVSRERESKDQDCDLEGTDYGDRRNAAKKFKTS